MKDNKKYFLNPKFVFLAWSMIIFGVLFCIFFLLTVKYLLWGGVVFALLSSAFIPYGIVQLVKYRGYLYKKDEQIIFRVGEKTEMCAVSDIRWIELTWDGIIRGPGIKGNKKNWRFIVTLKGRKKPVDFFISTHVMIDLIEEYQIRIMPDFLQKLVNEEEEYNLRLITQKKRR